ncbi:PSP1 family protein, partial [Cyberlindnera jadinii NRRL Y-1542]
MILVAFKAGRTDVFHLPSTTSFKLKTGDLVIVEADRGRDLGKVLRLDVSLDEARLLNGGTAQAPVPTLHYPKPILRFAMPNEACQIISKQADEEKAQKVCASKVSSFKLEMRVVDAEYQWDRRKLTLYYAASHRIDFRELVRELFRIYKTRIWMCAVVSNHQE